MSWGEQTKCHDLFSKILVRKLLPLPTLSLRVMMELALVRRDSPEVSLTFVGLGRMAQLLEAFSTD